MPRKCRGSWIDTYLEYTHNQESPTAFHEWTALSVVGAALGRNVWIPRIKYTIFPNLFVILVAGSGACRKSVSTNIGIKLLRSIKNPPMVFAQKITTEALIQALDGAKAHGASAGLIYASELSVFMGSDAVRSGIIPTLTDLYDSPVEWVYHTRGRGKEVLRNVTISVLAASTKDWLRSSIPADAVGGGFTSRIVFVCQNKPSRLLLFPENNPNEALMRENLIHDLNEIRTKVKGPLEFTPDAKAISIEWYEREAVKIRDAKLDGYFARKHDTMFKIAAILSTAESSNKMIERIHIKRALQLMEENEAHLSEIIAGVVANAVGGETERILNMVKKYKKISHSDLLRQCWRYANAADISMMIRTLIESGEVEETLSSDNRTRTYSLTK